MATALTRWDPDGAGPEPEQLIAGGRFHFVGAILAPGVAAWDPATETWSDVGGGITGFAAYEGVEDLLVWDDALVVAGHFWRAGDVLASNIARFDGAWKPLGLGLNGRVWALCESAMGELIVGGEFTSAGPTVNRIASWDGIAWKPIGAGAGGFDAPVHSLKVLANGDLVAGGSFSSAGPTPVSRIARWDGAAWHPLGAGVNGTVHAIEQMPFGWVVAGGEFTQAGGNKALAVAFWNGESWLAVGPGLGTGESYNRVSTLRLQPSGQLLAGGTFFEAGVTPALGVAMWDGTNWSQVGNGLFHGGGLWSLDIEESPDGSLVAAGGFSTESPSAHNMAQLSGGQWEKMANGTDGPVYALAEKADHSALVFGGGFKTIGGIAASGVAMWDGVNWNDMGGGVGELRPVGWESFAVRTVLAMQDGGIAVGGDFTRAGDGPAGSVAIWRDGAWDTLEGGILNAGQYPNLIMALLEVDGTLFVGGEFTQVGEVAACGLARWTPGVGWSPVGGGLCAGPNTMDSVNDMARLSDGDIVITGSGRDALGKTIKAIARWDGTEFHQFGDGMDELLETLLVTSDDAVIIGGQFGLLRWDGTAWWPVAPGLKGFGNDPAYILSLAMDHAGNLVAAGSFRFAGQVEANNIAAWDGSDWSAFGDGLSRGGVAAWGGSSALLRRANGELVVGGAFTEADGKASAYFARWGCAPAGCYADCDESGTLNINDFVCFQTLYAVGASEADCDGSATLNIDDFICFQTSYAVGC